MVWHFAGDIQKLGFKDVLGEGSLLHGPIERPIDNHSYPEDVNNDALWDLDVCMNTSSPGLRLSLPLTLTLSLPQNSRSLKLITSLLGKHGQILTRLGTNREPSQIHRPLPVSQVRNGKLG